MDSLSRIYHHHTELCKKGMSFTDFSEKCSNNKAIIVCLLEEDPIKLVSSLWSFEKTSGSLLALDEFCLYNNKQRISTFSERMAGISYYNEAMSPHFRCTSCWIVSSFLPKNYKVNKPCKVRDKQGKTVSLVLVSENISSPVIGIIMGKTPCIISDKFTNNLLINWTLSSKLFLKQMVGKTITGFICGNEALHLMKVPSIGRVHHVDWSEADLAEQVFKQLICWLDETTKIGLQDNQISSRDVLLDKSPISTKYLGVQLNAPICLKFVNFRESSLHLNKVCLKNVQKYSQRKPEMKTQHLNQTWIRFNLNSLVERELFIKNNDSSWWQVYGWLMVFVSNEKFFEEISKKDLWKSLFLVEQYPEICRRLKMSFEDKNSMSTPEKVVDILSGIYLRTDALNHCISHIQ